MLLPAYIISLISLKSKRSNSRFISFTYVSFINRECGLTLQCYDNVTALPSVINLVFTLSPTALIFYHEKSRGPITDGFSSVPVLRMRTGSKV